MSNTDKIFTIFCSLFSLLTVTGNLTYRKFVHLDLPLHNFELSVGVLLYPLAFLITGLISEFYGKERAKFCINLGLGMNIISATIVSFMDILPATSWSEINDQIFHEVFGFYGVCFAASIIACYISQSIDIRIYLFVKALTNGKYIWLRNYSSTTISLFIDTFVVIATLVSFDLLPREQMWNVTMNSYGFKMFFTICATPIFYTAIFIVRKMTINEDALNAKNIS
jgi:uncharacterized integral membrane protein (TIGR00697 family)